MLNFNIQVNELILMEQKSHSYLETYLYQLNDRRMARDADSCMPKNVIA